MLTFLKLGGSLITDKTRPFTALPERLDDLAAQIAEARKESPDLRLVIGHGSGSFGHTVADRHQTRQGVTDAEQWLGFAEVWYQASALNRLVIDAFHRAGLPVVTFSPAASVTAHDGKTFIWDLYPLRAALENGLIPVIHGDVAFDDTRGGTILSTEELFIYLAHDLHPETILLAGLEPGVWEDFPSRTRVLPEIQVDAIPAGILEPAPIQGTDVTGGMRSKVVDMLALIKEMDHLEVRIFTGAEKDTVRKALLGGKPGTRLYR